MSEDLDLKPLAKAIDETLPPGCQFVLIVVQKRADGLKDCQYVSAMGRHEAYSTIVKFVDATKNNFMFNPTGK